MNMKIGNKIRIKRGYKGQERKGMLATTGEVIELNDSVYGEIIDYDLYDCDYIIQIESELYYGLIVAVYENDIVLINQ